MRRRAGAGAVARVLARAARGRPPADETVSQRCWRRSAAARARQLRAPDRRRRRTRGALLRRAPGLRCSSTSQEPLKVDGRARYRLARWRCPRSTPTRRTRSDAGAVALFAARAEAVDPRFALTADNLPAVIEICRRLDGIPLAIELAAARVPLLGVEGLRARLGDRFSVLTAGARVVLRRHQTLRATLEWSHGLLTPDEQARVPAARRVRRQLLAGGRAARGAATRDRRLGGAGSPGRAGGQVAGARRRRSGAALPPARNHARLRARAARRGGRDGGLLRRHAEALLQGSLSHRRATSSQGNSKVPGGTRYPGPRSTTCAPRSRWAATADNCNELAIFARRPLAAESGVPRASSRGPRPRVGSAWSSSR